MSDLTVAPPRPAAAASASSSTSAPEPGQASASPDSPGSTAAASPVTTGDGPLTTSAPPATQAASWGSAEPTASGTTRSTASGTAEAAPAGAAEAVVAAEDPGSVRYTHSGYRFVLGYGADFFGIWDRQSPSTPAERFPRTDEGWRAAWTRFSAQEPRNVTVPQSAGGPSASPVSTPDAVMPDNTDQEALRYTHSGTRYLLGYGRTFFGIWDRSAPTSPVEKFPRDDTGWAAAWRRYTQIENHFMEVAGGAQPGSGTGTPV